METRTIMETCIVIQKIKNQISELEKPKLFLDTSQLHKDLKITLSKIEELEKIENTYYEIKGYIRTHLDINSQEHRRLIVDIAKIIYTNL